MNKLIRMGFGLMFVALLAGCVSALMKPVPEDQPVPVMEPGKVQVIFMRPSSFGGAIQSSVYDVTKEPNDFIGIVSSKTKIRYVTEPGEHLFMVIGESADFMAANLVEGKTYYALVTPRMGIWKARFSLKPVHQEQLASDEFRKWNDATRFVENTPESEQWAKDHWDSIQSKKTQDMPKWEAKSEADKLERTLNETDGT